MKTFDTPAAAHKFAMKVISDKHEKGYVDGNYGLGESVKPERFAQVISPPATSAPVVRLAECSSGAPAATVAESANAFVLGKGHMTVGQVVQVRALHD